MTRKAHRQRGGSAWAAVAALAILACGPRDRRGTVDAGDPCRAAVDCPIGTTCIGCSQSDLRCLPGCSSDDDCPIGACTEHVCATCPCPGSC